MTHTPFCKVLVANRGEIAVRIIRSARANGYATVAVYSEADANALHVKLADQAVCIGPPAPSKSYLSIDAIIAAAQATGADAIHPGYGFLAENEKLPAACKAAGIVFVGPSAEAIRAMGDKAGAKKLMIDAGVPCVPGYQGDDQSEERLVDEARKIGWPVMIKATAGGGGRGMRLVETEDAFADALKSARSEAKAAFGDDRILLEKAVQNPRHIEIQIIADRHGAAVHLGERDCSVQRRHQKVIEESPSPAVSGELRKEMGATAVRAARAIGYEGAGTLEFLLAGDGSWYFMEMNTRLQVEHPVTEAITGLDLVALQFTIASGAPLGLTQEDIRLKGHAIEVRLCAEEPEAGFMPQSGVMTLWQPAPGIRVDHGLESGSSIPPFYDSMIAKLVAHGPDRETARRSLLQGLEDTVALGVRTNQAFLQSCLNHPAFVAGEATTAFIGLHQDDLLGDRNEEEERVATLLAAILCAAPGIALTHGFATPVRIGRNGEIHERRVQAWPWGRCDVFDASNQPLLSVEVRSAADGQVRFTTGGVETHAVVSRDGERVLIHTDGRSWDFIDLSHAPATSADAAGGDGKVRASMTGRIVAVEVAVGDRVLSGQKVVVLEAMKMEHTHASAVEGTVTAIHVGNGDQVEAHRVMVEVESA